MVKNSARAFLAAARTPARTLAFEWRRRTGRAMDAGGGQRVETFVAEAKAGLFDYLDGEERVAVERREAELRDGYRLGSVLSRLSRRDHRDVIDRLEMLECARDAAGFELQAGDGEVLRVVDVGVQSWNYVAALSAFCATRAPSAGAFELDGIEIDAATRVAGPAADGARHARAEYARGYARVAARGREAEAGLVLYHAADFRRWRPRAPGRVDAVTMFFPFVTRYACADWGLPPYLFDPEAVVARALEILRPEGLMLSVHQTAAECARMRELVEAADGGEVVGEIGYARKHVAYWPKTAGRRILVSRRGRE